MSSEEDLPTSTFVSKMNKDAQMRAAINQKLIETGERERLKELLRAKLIECGWKDQLKAHCKEVIKEKGLEHVTVDDLVAEITPKGRGKEHKTIRKQAFCRGKKKTFPKSWSCLSAQLPGGLVWQPESHTVDISQHGQCAVSG